MLLDHQTFPTAPNLNQVVPVGNDCKTSSSQPSLNHCMESQADLLGDATAKAYLMVAQ